MSAPAIPAGYRRLKVGEKKPEGYKWWDVFENAFAVGYWKGEVISEYENKINGPYIAPARKARKEGGKR